MATVWVYAELAGGEVSKPALEILTKARDLGDTAAVVLGSGAKEAATALGEHGAQTVYAGDDAVFDEHLAQPKTLVLRGKDDALQAWRRELARVFDENGISWLYEPHTLVLERDAALV